MRTITDDLKLYRKAFHTAERALGRAVIKMIEHDYSIQIQQVIGDDGYIILPDGRKIHAVDVIRNAPVSFKRRENCMYRFLLFRKFGHLRGYENVPLANSISDCD